MAPSTSCLVHVIAGALHHHRPERRASVVFRESDEGKYVPDHPPLAVDEGANGFRFVVALEVHDRHRWPTAPKSDHLSE